MHARSCSFTDSFCIEHQLCAVSYHLCSRGPGRTVMQGDAIPAFAGLQIQARSSHNNPPGSNYNVVRSMKGWNRMQRKLLIQE